MHPLTKIASRRLREEVEDIADRVGSGGDLGGRVGDLKSDTRALLSQVTGSQVDIFAEEDHLLLLVDAPGYRREDLDLTVQGVEEVEQVHVRGDRRKPRDAEPLREERVTFLERTVELPEPCDPDGVTASLEEGVLTVRLPRLDRGKGKKVDIKWEKSTEVSEPEEPEGADGPE